MRPFRVLDDFKRIVLTLLERMAGTTRLELATSAVTANGVGGHLLIPQGTGCHFLIVPLLYPDLAGFTEFLKPILITLGLPTTRKVARLFNTSAFVGANPKDEPITHYKRAPLLE